MHNIMHAVSLGETIHEIVFVLVCPFSQIICHTDI